MNLPTVVDAWLWPAFIVVVVLLILGDLLLGHKENKIPSQKESLLWSALWVGLSLSFTAWFGYRYGTALGFEFLTGYLVELSLSVDNLFVILLIFKSFKIPANNQHRVLFWGILGAIIFRGILIVVGVDLIHKFDWLMYVFGLFLVFTGLKFVFESDKEKDVTDSALVKTLGRYIPLSTSNSSGRFFLREGGQLKATTLFLALIVIEISDLVFAVDSIPAVLAITRDAFIAFGSNILAILGLRALYFVIAEWVSSLRYLKPGLAVILMFIGIKMLTAGFVHISSWVSLLVIIGVLSTAALTSWYAARAEKDRHSQ